MASPHAFPITAVALACAAGATLLACAGSSDPTTSGSSEAIAATSKQLSPEALAVNPTKPPNVGSANHFQLSGANLQITYDYAATPVLIYQDSQRIRIFRGNEITVTATPVGTLATVVLIPTIDTGSTTFSLLVPPVRVGSNAVAAVETEGLTVVHRFSVVPGARLGQLDEYNFTALEGSARLVGAIVPPPTATSVVEE